MKRLFFLAIFLALAGQAWGATYYVSQDGDGDGTSISTPDDLAGFNAGAFGELDGDTVYFLDEISTADDIDCPDTGTAGGIITLRGDYPGRECTLTSTGTQGIEVNVDYIVVRGFTVVGGTANGIRLWSSLDKNYVLITENTIHDTGGEGIHIRHGGSFGGVVISNNTIYSYGTDGTGIGIYAYSDGVDDSTSAITGLTITGNTIYNTTESTSQAGIRIQSRAEDTEVSNIDISYNTIYDIPHCGIEYYGALAMSGGLIHHNTITNTKASSVHIGSGIAITSALVYENYLDGTYQDPTVDASGILFDSNSDGSFGYRNTIKNAIESGIKISSTNSCTVYNNIIIGNTDHGIEIRRSDPFTSDGHKVYFNTIYHNGTGNGIDVDEGTPGTNSPVLLTNNVVYDYGDSPAGIYINSGAVATESYNCVYGFTNNFASEAGAIAAGTGSITSDPLFVNPGGAIPNNYKLRHTSPCIDAGTPIAGITTDHFGRTRIVGAAPDIGAIESRYHRRRWRWR